MTNAHPTPTVGREYTLGRGSTVYTVASVNENMAMLTWTKPGDIGIRNRYLAAAEFGRLVPVIEPTIDTTGAYLEPHTYDSFPKPVPFWIVRCNHPSHGPIALNSGHHYRENNLHHARALIAEHNAEEHPEPAPYVARNGNRFTADQARLITEPLRYDPEMAEGTPVLPYCSGCKHASPCANVYAGRACALDATKANGYDAEGRATVTYLEDDEAQGVAAGSVVYALDPYTGRPSGQKHGDPAGDPAERVRASFEVTESTHPIDACPKCRRYADAAVSHAMATGSTGATYGEDGGQAFSRHMVTVKRPHPVPGL